jgi:hypothetical protein
MQTTYAPEKIETDAANRNRAALFGIESRNAPDRKAVTQMCIRHCH